MSTGTKVAAVYARYSSSSQTEQSIEGQLHDAYDFADRNGYTIVKEYIDRALSGTNDSRPAFQQMIRDSEKKTFQYILVWKLDRFARNRYDSAVYKRTLSRNGVRVVSVKENITDTPEGVILEGLLEAMAEYYSADLSQKIKRGRHESVRKGLFPGGPVPYGYLVEDRRLVPDPRTAPVVKEIFTRYVDGERLVDIFTDLNARGLRARRGAPFQYATLSHILDNKTYMGDYYYGDTLIRSAVTPLIDEDTFNRATARRAFNHRCPAAFRCEESRSLLLGKLFCGECGHKMTGARGSSASGLYFYYQCDGKNRRHTRCGMKGVQKHDIEYAACRIVSDLFLHKSRSTLFALADTLMEAYAADIDMTELEALRSQLKQTERDLDKLVDSLICMPESARPRIAQRMEALEVLKKDLECKVAQKAAEQSMYFNRDDFVKYLQVTFEDLSDRGNQRFIIDHFINSVYLYNDGRLIVYLNQLRGLPYRSPDDDPPGTDFYKDVSSILREDSLPAEISKLSGFSSCSSLYTYAPTYVNKDEQSAPLLFFLHGRVGVIAWRHPVQNELVRDHGKIIKQVSPLKK
jgi:DNA invertase Pin-like site-specific DNA recombinase